MSRACRNSFKRQATTRFCSFLFMGSLLVREGSQNVTLALGLHIHLRSTEASAQRESTLGGGGINLLGLHRISMVADQPVEFLRGQSFAEMKPLVLIAAQLLQQCELVSCFNPLSDPFQIPLGGEG